MRLALTLMLSLAVAAPALADGKGKGGKAHKGNNGVVTFNCPPGLAKKNPPCVPPGQAKGLKFDEDHPRDWYVDDRRWRVGDRIRDGYVWVRDPWRYGLPDRGTYWRVGDNFFRVDRDTGEILAILGILSALRD